MKRYRATVSIHCVIYDDQALLTAATSIATRDMTLAAAMEVLWPDGEVDVGACLQMILDPGYVTGAGFEVEGSDCGVQEVAP